MSTVQLLSPRPLTSPNLAVAPALPRGARIPAGFAVLGRFAMAAIDVGVVLAAFLVAYWIRFVLPAEELALGIEQYVHMGLTLGVVACGLLALHGTYSGRAWPAWPARVNATVSALSTAAVLSLAIAFIRGDAPISRLWFATGWALAVVLLVTWRGLSRRPLAALGHAFAPASRILIVGANGIGEEVATELASHRCEVLGYVDNGTDLERLAEFPLLGPISQLEQLVTAHAVDEVVVALPAGRREQVSRIIARGFHRPVTIKVLPALNELLPQRFEVHQVGGRSYIGFTPVAPVSWLKRAMDLMLTGMALIGLAPVLLAVMLAIKLDSPGPVFYRQKRVGKNGEHFGMLKFRSMCIDADKKLTELRARNEATGPLFKMREDPRVTRVGRFIRRWSLDELPQLFNVIRGEMSLVGPRPPLPSEVEQYEDWQHGRLRAIPGLTGLWQVSGRSEVPFHDMVRLDLHYIRNWSLGLDFEIMLRTIPAVFTNRGAY